MADFAKAFAKLLPIEGGFVDDPADRGGATKYGISKRAYPELDIASLTLEQAAAIYRRDYWDALRLGPLFRQELAEEIFDSAVNCGPGNAVRWLQRALNLVGGFAPGNLAVDGALGPATLAATNACRYPQALLKALNGLQFLHYWQLVERHPSQARFFRGWLRRVWEHPSQGDPS